MSDHPEEPQSSGPSKITLAIVILVAILALIFILSNSQQADFKFLSLQIEMPKWLLFTVLVAGGVLIGWGTAAFRYRREKQQLRKQLD